MQKIVSKKFYNFILLFFSVFTLELKAQWVNNSNPFTSSQIRAVAISSGSSAVLGGFGLGSGFSMYGIMYLTTNGGVTMKEVYRGTTGIEDICFVTSTIGYAIGNDADLNVILCKTLNAGLTWSSSTISGLFSTESIVHFVNTSVGFIFTDNGIISKTIDGGENWVNISHNVGNNFKDVSFISPKIAFAVSVDLDYSILSQTTDGGQNWVSVAGQNLAKTTSFVNKIDFITENIGFMISNSNSHLYKTTNGGVTWTSISGLNFDNIYEVKFITTSTGILSATDNNSINSSLYRTFDGGLTWSKFHDAILAFSLYDFDYKNNFIIASGLGGYCSNKSFDIYGANSSVSTVVSTITSTINHKKFDELITVFPNPSKNGVFFIETNLDISSIIVYNNFGHSETHDNKVIKTNYKGLVYVKINLDSGEHIYKKIFLE